MIVFLACSGGMLEGWKELRDRYAAKINVLRSYWEISEFDGHTLSRHGVNQFLDSGAFSAWSQGISIDVKHYGAWVKRYESQLQYYANLDAIPRSSAPGERKAAAQKTLENQLALEDMGLKPIPVFHKGEPWEYLERYLAKYDYICLGGLVADAKAGGNKEFFDEVWSKYLADEKGKPKAKIHAFGMTSLQHMVRYPWFSADSSTWMIQSNMGFICIPMPGTDGFDFDRYPFSIAISDKSGARRFAGEHYDTLSPSTKRMVDDYLASLKVSVKDLKADVSWRYVVNLAYWLGVQEHASFTTRWQKRQVELL